MEIGCCVSYRTLAPRTRKEASPGQIEQIELLKEVLRHLKHAGYDFAEFSVGMVDEGVSDEDYEALCSAVDDCGVPVAAFNGFIPGRLKIVGPEACLGALRCYVDIALERAARIGASVVVFGSGAARKVPDDWPVDIAEQQIREFVEMAGEIAEVNDIRIAIEHLNRGETNIGNSLQSVGELARDVDLFSVGVLADLYHLDVEGEGLDSIFEVSDLLMHTHVADTDRLHPGSGSADLEGFVKALRGVGYDEGISVECAWNDFMPESIKAAAFLRDLILRS